MDMATRLQVEVRPRDIFKHYVHVQRPGDILQWSFSTKRKNIAFGLYYLYLSGGSAASSTPPDGLDDGPLKETDQEQEAAEELQQEITVSCEFVHELFNQSASLVKIEPHAFSAGKKGSSRRDSHDSLPDTNPTGPPASSGSLNAPPADAAPMLLRVPSPLGELVEILPIEKYPSFEAVVRGSLDAPISGTYVLVFDNSFSINTAKQLLFSVDVLAASLSSNDDGKAVESSGGATILSNNCGSSIAWQGWLLKKKRRRLQGWSRRWFALDQRGTLAYGETRGGPVRGAMNVADCSVTKVPSRWLITLDSGQDTFHLKALSVSDYATWADKIRDVRNGALARLPRASETLGGQLRDCQRHVDDLKVLVQELDGQVVGRFLGPLESTLSVFHAAFEGLRSLALDLGIIGEDASPSNHRLCRHSLHSDDELAGLTEEPEDVFYDVVDEVVISDVSESDYQDSLAGDLPRMEGVLGSGAPTPEPMLLPGPRQRTSLPVPSGPCTVSIASILRKSIGKDSSGFSMPVGLNEPLSALQKMCEELEHVDLIDKAADLDDHAVLQLAYVVAFAVSAYAPLAHRADRKPFNPMLGETFEWIDGDLRFVGEKVAHRPLTVLACHAERLGRWTYVQDQAVKSKNWGKSIEYIPVGLMQLQLLGPKATSFQWRKVVSCLRNIWSSTKTIENYGDMTIVASNGLQAIVSFKSSSFFGGSAENAIAGFIANAEGQQLAFIRGRWDDHVLLERPGHDLKMLWKASAMPPNYRDFFGFSYFALRLNAELEAEEERLVPPTDSRRRPDQRLLEYGRLEEAELEKVRIEGLQRKRRAEMEAVGQVHQPRWFALASSSSLPQSSSSSSSSLASTPINDGDARDSFQGSGGEVRYVFTERYWEEKLSVNYVPLW
jgi:hypothetical protein